MLLPKIPGAIAGAIVVVVALLAGYVGVEVGRNFERNWQCCQVPTARRVLVSFQDLVGAGGFTSDRGQDKWVTEAAFPGVTSGFFADVGSGDGRESSNTASLERLGWKGICIDAFPRNMEGRTCRVFQEAVDREAGRRVTFYQAGDLGGISEYLGRAKSLAEQGKATELVTTTLGEILDRAKAPSFIHFMSLDIEGAELAALEGFPFDKYQVGAFIIEHNFEAPKRGDIQQLLERHGYELAHAWFTDDFYLPRR
jgi:hypothetical protein